MNNNIYLKFYLSKRERKWKFYKECYNQQLKETKKCYNTFGKDGFLSEKIYKKDIKTIAKREAEREWDVDKNCKFEINSIPIKRNEEKEQISIIENNINFVKWLI